MLRLLFNMIAALFLLPPYHLQMKEIQKEAHVETDPVQQKDAKQTAAVDLISRLNNYRSYSDSSSVKGGVSSGIESEVGICGVRVKAEAELELLKLELGLEKKGVL
ncbi:hypothetical protein K7X08_021081 [Anisodus acutangulus]|uniref:Uncharacterized protein n=1 Tax=Anisodus acutangulus TaxID=402998 RepID=A0A9Q1M0J3_9SOLA|nr:hypothetical protein K7X08_021081 [Anisodus acutangulus]